MNKVLIRREMIEKRKSISQVERNQSSLRATQFFIHHPLFLNSQKIAVYVLTLDELDTRFLIEEILKAKKHCYLPVIDQPQKKCLSFVRCEDWHTLRLNRLHILEPSWDPVNAIPAENLELVIVPHVAFDSSGTRLGKGGGYYDRAFQFLNHCQRPTRPFLCGWAYHFQEYPSLPKDSWDVTLDAVVTDQYFLDCSSRGQKGEKIFYEI